MYIYISVLWQDSRPFAVYYMGVYERPAVLWLIWNGRYRSESMRPRFRGIIYTQCLTYRGQFGGWRYICGDFVVESFSWDNFRTLAFKEWEEILKTNIMYIIAKPGVRNICNNKCLCLIGNNKSSEQCLSKSVLLYKTIRVYVESKSTNIRYLPWNISSSICV